MDEYQGSRIEYRKYDYIEVAMKNNLPKFKISVLKATLKIPLGQTRTYQWLAKKIGNPKAVRAVGNALKKNPFPLIIPCHRVIKSDSKIGGYAGGTKMKKYLLELEKQIAAKLHL
ncbi:MAG: MGMT family protein [Candidatus Omnitrophota bacterium]|nr:MGMT family protein [Candidatus Omnitrophota bacterium]